MPTYKILSPTIVDKVLGHKLVIDEFLTESPYLTDIPVPKGQIECRVPRLYAETVQSQDLDKVTNPIGSGSLIPSIRTNMTYETITMDRNILKESIDQDISALLRNPQYFPPEMQEAMLWRLKASVKLIAERKWIASANYAVVAWGSEYNGAGGEWDVMVAHVSSFNPFINANSGLITRLQQRWLLGHQHNLVMIPHRLWFDLTNNTLAQAQLFPGVTVGVLPDITVALVEQHLSNRCGWNIKIQLLSAQYAGVVAANATNPGVLNNAYVDTVYLATSSQITAGAPDTFYRFNAGEEVEEVSAMPDRKETDIIYTARKMVRNNLEFGAVIYNCANLW